MRLTSDNDDDDDDNNLTIWILFAEVCIAGSTVNKLECMKRTLRKRDVQIRETEARIECAMKN